MGQPVEVVVPSIATWVNPLCSITLPIDQVALPTVGAARVGQVCPNQKIVQTITVDIIRAGDGDSGLIPIRDAVELGPGHVR